MKHYGKIKEIKQSSNHSQFEKLPKPRLSCEETKAAYFVSGVACFFVSGNSKKEKVSPVKKMGKMNFKEWSICGLAEEVEAAVNWRPMERYSCSLHRADLAKTLKCCFAKKKNLKVK